MRKTLAALVVAVGALALTSCAREIDETGVGAEQIPGSGGIFRFCDGPTLIYFTSRDGSEDEIEAIWPDMCYPLNGTWVYSTDPADYSPEGNPTRVDGNVPDNE